jgi:uncharacterized GH25 family protein
MKWKQTIALLFLAVPLLAHDLYLMPERFAVEKGSQLTVAVHNGDAFPESEASPALERVRDFTVVSAAGSTEVQNVRVADKAAQGEVQVEGKGGLILTVRTVPNLLTLPAEEFDDYLKEEGLDAVIEWRAQHGESKAPSRERYSKYAKSLISSGGENKFHSHPVGMAIEIVPERSPVGLKAGDSLPVRVLFRGQPASGLQIESTWAGAAGPAKKAIVGRTDKDGRIVVPLASTGKWRIHTIRMERCTEPSVADWESYWASLTFELR